jgi:hypothetical protein
VTRRRHQRGQRRQKPHRLQQQMHALRPTRPAETTLRTTVRRDAPLGPLPVTPEPRDLHPPGATGALRSPIHVRDEATASWGSSHGRLRSSEPHQSRQGGNASVQ